MTGEDQPSREQKEKEEAKEEVLKTLNHAREVLSDSEWIELLNLTCLTVKH